MRKLILPSFLLVLLCASVALNVMFIFDEDKEEYLLARIYESPKDLEFYLVNELKLNPKDALLVLEIIKQNDNKQERIVELIGKEKWDELNKYLNSSQSNSN